MNNNRYINIIANILCDSGLISHVEKKNFNSLFSFEKVYADGSLRNFIRVKRGGTSICIGVFPSETMVDGLEEAYSASRIGSHLFNKGIPVPEIFGADRESGLVIFEDCGDVRLYDLLPEKDEKRGAAIDDIVSLYRHIIEILVYMQIKGAEDFKTKWCYDTAVYDREVMIKKESEYFLNSFWHDLLDGEIYTGINEEFEEIAVHAGTGLNHCFLHRDFQCRNIMVAHSGIRIIDFQAGRLGPPGYDLASLLIDPYSSLSMEFREDLLEWYLGVLQSYVDFDEKGFRNQFMHLILQRNMQILGAFSFLYKKRDKLFFKDFIVPSLQNLRRTLSQSQMQPYTRIRGIVDKAETLIAGVI